MRVYTKIGDIYCFRAEPGNTRFFQYVAKDQSNMGIDVIRVFKTNYTNDRYPAIDTIVMDDTECCFCTSVKAGVKLGFWNKYGHSSVIRDENLIFRSSLDYGFHPKIIKRSQNWVVWAINGERRFVGILPPCFYGAYLGIITPPRIIIERINAGIYEPPYYPTYK